MVSALIATSSFVITTPRVSEALLLASVVAALLLANAPADKSSIVVAIFLCVALAGLWQSIFGLAGVAKIIKFTPHPVLVGFLNGVAVLVVISQLKPYFQLEAGTSHLAVAGRPGMFVLLVGIATLMLAFPFFVRTLAVLRPLAKVPPVIIGFGGGIAAFYMLKGFNPDLDLGPTVGHVRLTLSSPLADLASLGAWRQVADLVWFIAPTSLVLAVIATLDTLFAFRTAQNASDLSISPVRDLFAQGISNVVAAVAGGVMGAASPGSTMAAWRAGGRTRIAPITSALALLALTVFAPAALAGIPSVVLSGILLATGILLFDRGTLELAADMRKDSSPVERRRALYDLAVVLIVMGITVFYSMVAGVVTGCLLAGAIFIMNMSRPIVGRVFYGSDIHSKRIRPATDMDILRDTAAHRAVLMLEGVLFFGNADDLSARIKALFDRTDVIALDLRDITDIDVSGANILSNLVSKSRTRNKTLLFCDVPQQHESTIHGLFVRREAAAEAIKRDLNSALEWMEEKSLQLHADRRGKADVLALRDIDFLSGLAEADLERLAGVVTEREFAAGETICREGDEGDRMWLLAKGSVSVRLISPDGRSDRRIASLSRGTTIGEMALVETARRSATIVADEHVVCYELPREGLPAWCPIIPGSQRNCSVTCRANWRGG